MYFSNFMIVSNEGFQKKVKAFRSVLRYMLIEIRIKIK